MWQVIEKCVEFDRIKLTQIKFERDKTYSAPTCYLHEGSFCVHAKPMRDEVTL